VNDQYVRPEFEHGETPEVGVLLANMGTPDAPTAKALRSYLHQFLRDPRVIELPRWRWLPILYLLVLTLRPRRSAALYSKVWTDEGSPLLVIGRRQAAALHEMLGGEDGRGPHIALGMAYGAPSIATALAELRGKGCRKILVLPLYPQYSGTTTGATFDAVFAELRDWRWVPEVRTINAYHDDPGYIAAIANSVREVWDRDGKPERLLFSFHGIPLRYVTDGDPYHCQCHKTGRLVAEALGIGEDSYVVAFQSQFGREEWIKPTTDVTVRAMARAGIKSLDIVCPGFSADCLETLEEIDVENREFFENNGGERFRFIPCLNDRPDHIGALAGLVASHLTGWNKDRAADAGHLQLEARASKQRADRMIASQVRADAGYGS